MKLRPCQDGPFVYRPGVGVTVNGRPMKGGVIGQLIVGACMSANGDVVPWKELAKHAGGEDPRGVIRVVLHQTRRKLERFGAVGVLETVTGKGVRWNSAALERKEAA